MLANTDVIFRSYNDEILSIVVDTVKNDPEAKQRMLKAIFDIVCDPEDWKNPTKTVYTLSELTSGIMEEAMIHFTGGATVKRYGANITIKSKGYRHYMGD